MSASQSIYATAAECFTAAHRAAQAGLSLREFAVLALLASAFEGDDEGTTVAISQFELAQALGVSPTAAQRSLSGLRDKGYIARRQDVKRSGCVAHTTLMPVAWAFFGAAPPATALPVELGELLVLQPRSVLLLVSRAYAGRTDIPLTAPAGFVGQGDAWEQIARYLRLHVIDEGEARAQALLATAHGEESVQLSLHSGEQVTVDLATFRSIAPVDVPSAFLVDVLKSLVGRPGITVCHVSRLLAEAAYSRAVGFVRGHSYDRGVSVLTAVMARSTWGRPRSIRQGWYAAAQRVCRVFTGCAVPAY